MVIALLTAAGLGTRMGQDIPKQFIHVNNKPLIVYTMEAFESHPGIDEIMVVTLPEWTSVLRAYANQFNISKLKHIEVGGSTGQESIHNGLMAMKEFLSDDDVVIVHDGNRCFVSSEIISDAIATFYSKGSAAAAIPCVEAVFELDGESSSHTHIPREKLVRTQTPQVYKYSDIVWAHNEAEKRSIENTASTCVLMQELGQTVYFSKGSELNLKVTTTDDLKIFESLLENNGSKSWLKNA